MEEKSRRYFRRPRSQKSQVTLRFAGPGSHKTSRQDEQPQENQEALAKESELFKNYDGQMVRELRGLCRARGLPSNGTKAKLKAALAKDDEERRPVEAKAASVKDAEPEAAVQAGVPVGQRLVWLQGADVTYDVLLDAGATGADLRRRATPDVSDRQRANVKLVKADGTELDLDDKVPLDAGSSSKSPVRVEGAPSSEFQAGGLLRFAFRAGPPFLLLRVMLSEQPLSKDPLVKLSPLALGCSL